MSFVSSILHRQTHGKTDRQGLRYSLLSQLKLDDSRRFKVHRDQHVTSIDVDVVDQRYALVATGLGNIEVFDLHTRPVNSSMPSTSATSATSVASGTSAGSETSASGMSMATSASLTPLSSMPREHTRMISAVQWYPVDTGLFISACRNGRVNLWDTNHQQVVWKCDFEMPVNDAAMSPIAKEHMLIAVAAQDSTVRLCDPRSGSSTHFLSGHASEISSLSWSPRDPFTLVSGSHDSGIRVWDIRRSGTAACIAALDQHRTSATVIHQTGGAMSFSSSASSSSSSSSSSSTSTPSSSSSASYSRPHKRQRLDVQTQIRRSACMAHNGKVTCVTHTPDGRYLVSAGTDDQMRCWNMSKNGINTLTHYTGFTNPCPVKSWMLVMQPSNYKSPVIVHPSGTRNGKDGTIDMYDMVKGGHRVHSLNGHWKRSNCGCYIDNGGEVEVLTGGADGNVMTWRYCKVDREMYKEGSDQLTAGEGDNDEGLQENAMSRVWGGEDAWSD